MTPYHQFLARLGNADRGAPFNPWRRPVHPAAVAFVAGVQGLIQSVRRWRPQAWPMRAAAIEALAADALHRHYSGEEAIYLSLRTAASARTRYDTGFTGRPLVEAVRALEERRCLTRIATGAKHCGRSTFTAGPELLRLAKHFGVPERGAFGLDPFEEVMIAKRSRLDDDYVPGEDRLIDYKDDEVGPLVADLRAWVRVYNEWVEAADIECEVDGIDVTDRRLRRIYHDLAFTLGGRLYGGFWQNMRSALRPAIRINGRPTVTLDYRATMLTLAYAHVGEQLPDGDPYAIPGFFDQRAGVKSLVSALLCVDEPLTRWPRKALAAFRDADGELVADLQTATAAIKAHHPALAPVFETGIGLRLMNTESRILVDVLNSCQRRGYVALPIHDAVVVRADQADEVAHLMRAWFQGHTTIAPVVSRK